MNFDNILNSKDCDLKHPKENVLFKVSFIISLIVWIGLVIITFGFAFVYAAFILLGIVIGKYIFIANIRGNGIKITKKQFTKLNDLINNISKSMDLKEIPEVYIYESSGVLNAFALNIFSRNFVVITTKVLDACEDDEDLIAFVLGHEIAHLHLKHSMWLSFLLPSDLLVPWLGNAYSRACEYTADALSIKHNKINYEKILLAITILATASKKRSMNLDKIDFINQSKSVENFWGGVAYGESTHPFTNLRFARINELAGGEKIAKPNIWGVFFSGLFSKQILVWYMLVLFISVGFVLIPKSEKEVNESCINEEELYSEYDRCIDICELDDNSHSKLSQKQCKELCVESHEEY